MIKLDPFTHAYLVCAMWSSTGEDGAPLDDLYSLDDLADSALLAAAEDCERFQRTYADDLAQAGDQERNGHDLWLTRNGHGAGFWDRGYGAVGRRLTDAAHAEGSTDVYVGDDGFVHLT